MRETIYTIPINEAFDKKCGCSFCNMYDVLDKSEVEYALGAAMMEPDSRIVSNTLGFCRDHYKKMLKAPNKLSLALVLDTHLEEVRKTVKAYPPENKKSSLFKKSDDNEIRLTEKLDDLERSCAVCARIDKTMDRYVQVFFDMWQHDTEFLAKFDEADGFCLPHFKMLFKKAKKHLGSKAYGEFVSSLYEKEEKALTAMQNDIHRFVLKFDYRNADMPWENAKDAPKRTIELLCKQIEEDN